MTPNEWRLKNNLNFRQFAEKMGVPYETGRRHCLGDRRPEDDFINTYYEKSEGEIDANSIVISPELLEKYPQ